MELEIKNQQLLTLKDGNASDVIVSLQNCILKEENLIVTKGDRDLYGR